jgi:signal transduction histidine kinase
LLHIGVIKGHSFEDTRKIKAVNFGVLLSVPLQLFFAFLNVFSGYYFLAFLNSMMVLGNVTISMLQYYRKYRMARVLYVGSVMAFFTYTPIYYHNSAEYILILNIAGILLLFDQRPAYLLLIVLDIVCFIFVKIQVGFVEPAIALSGFRNFANLIVFFLGLTTILLYYKRQQTIYQRKLEKMNHYLNKRSKSLEDLNKSKEKIFSILSHDLRQPLVSVKSLLQLMNRNALKQETFMEFSGKVNNSLDHIILSLDNTLNWSIGQLQGMRARPEQLELYEISGDVYEQLQDNIHHKELVFIDNIQVSARIYADKEQVTIILRNLLSNAIKFTPKGGLIHLSAKEKAAHWEISLEDNGMGMNEEMIGSLFDLGRHFTRRGTENEKGTGLGLTLVKELVKMNEGNIAATSIPGKGTVFSLLLKKAE